MEQNKITIDGENLFKEVAITDSKSEGVPTDEVGRLIREQYPWQLNDAEKLYSGIITELPDTEEEQRKQTERQSFLSWLADKPQRIYGGESWNNFLKILDSYSDMHNLRKFLEAFYNGGEYQKMVEKLMKYEDRATEIPLIMAVDSQEDERVVHSEIRKVWFPKLNKQKSVIILVIDMSKLKSMGQE